MKNTIKILYAIINTHKERLFTFLLIAILISGAMYGFLLKNRPEMPKKMICVAPCVTLPF
jgi:hypothetical protein